MEATSAWVNGSVSLMFNGVNVAKIVSLAVSHVAG